MNTLPFLLFLLLALSARVLSVRLTVLHTNDVHGRFEQVTKSGSRCTEADGKAGKCYGGAARLQTKLNEIRKEGSNVLFLNAGDYYQGTLYFNLFNHTITSDFMNRADYDAMSLGNHEFDNKVIGLVPFLNEKKFPVLVCNMDVSSVPTLNGSIGCIHTIKLDNGEEVGIVGYLTPETATLSNPGLNVTFTEEISALKVAVGELREAGVKIIIALGHSGFTKDKEIAEKVEGLDIVVGGHTNTFLYTGKPPTDTIVAGPYPYVITRPDGSKVLVVQDYGFGIYLGNLITEFDQDGRLMSWEGNPIVLDSKVKEDPTILAALEPYKKKVEEYGSKVVGTTDVLLRGADQYCRMRECNLGNFLTDAVVSYYRTIKTGYKDNPVRIALWNSGGIRASIDELDNQGNITVADVILVAPFGNDMDVMEISGLGLLKVMEHSVVRYDVDEQSPPGGFLQISGLKVIYDVLKPAGSRVISLEALCNKCRVPKYFAVEEQASYTVALPNYLVGGGDGFHVVKEYATNIHEAGDSELDIIMAYIKRTSPVFATVEGRITILKNTAGGQIKSSLLLVLTNIFYLIHKKISFNFL